MSSATVTLLTKPGCHLCDVAREAVAGVVQGLDDSATVTVIEKSILDDPDLASRYAEEIPVVLIGDRVHTIWRVDPVRLRAAILEE